MKYTELEESDVSYISEIYFNQDLSWDQRINLLSERFKRSERTVLRWISKLGLSTKPAEESPQLTLAKQREIDLTKSKFIITWAQNNTHVHEEFITNLEAYAKHIDASIHVIAGRYKNPTSVFTDKKYDEWSDRILPYLDANRHDVHKYVSIMSDVKIQPTATDPMTGLQGMSGINSCVFGSPKVHLEMIPVLVGSRPKMMLTTGACTVKNYTDSKSGKKGEFHHTLGFVIIEIENEESFFVRQVTANDNGDFNDLYFNVSFSTKEKKSIITRNSSISALVMGDLHFGQHDQQVVNATFDLMEKLHPEHVVLHDVFDGASINHHESKDPFAQYHKEISGKNSLKREIEEMLENLSDFQDYQVVIVRSNHDDFVDRWLKDTDWRKTMTPKNSLEYMQFSATLLSGLAPNGIIPYLIQQRFPNFKTLGRNDSYLVKGWELGQHGDLGSNGSRGSLMQMRKLNTKIVVGHYHSPGRKDGALSVGTSTKLRLNYNSGASNWLQSHVIIHNDGKAQHLNFFNGKFTTLK